MKLQIITNQNLTKASFPDVTICNLGKPRSLDEFDVVIIDLSSPSIWRYEEPNPNSIDCQNDFLSIKQMVNRKTHAVVVYVFPRNVLYHYSTKYNVKKSILIKDHIGPVIEILKNVVANKEPSGKYTLLYESTSTKINGLSYEADFYFDGDGNPITRSIASSKTTTIQWTSSVYLTTLDILKSEKELQVFLDAVVPKKRKEAEPEWVKQTYCFDDADQYSVIENNQAIINDAEEKIKGAEQKLKENSRLKSILYTNGDELVEVVFDVLQRMLDCDLSSFVDEKKEDFLIKKEAYTLIGEIKGVTSNIKNEHITQVEVHYQNYMDILAQDNRQENVRPILIINPFRDKPLAEREPVNEKQIALAKRNGCLMVKTETLLKLYEKFVAGIVDVSFCEGLLSEKTGLLEESDF